MMARDEITAARAKIDAHLINVQWRADNFSIFRGDHGGSSFSHTMFPKKKKMRKVCHVVFMQVI